MNENVWKQTLAGPGRERTARILLVMVLVLGGTLAWRAARAAEAAKVSVEDTFKQALFEEEGRRNYEAAVRGYETVVQAMDEQRRLAATAVFRLAECYRKLARTNDAVAQYERVLRDFAGEEVLVRLSRENLGALGARPTSAGGEGSAGSPVRAGRGDDGLHAQVLAQDAALLESQMEALKRLEGSKLVAALLTLFPGPSEGIARIRKDLATHENRLQTLEKSLGHNHPEYVAERSLVMVSAKRLESEVQDVMGALTTRLEALKAAIERMPTGSPGAGPGPGAARVPGSAVGAGAEAMTSEEAEAIRKIQGLVANSPDLINAAGANGMPLVEAAAKGQVSVVTYLLDHGARVDASVPGQSGALHAAADAGHKKVVELLLARGATVDVRGANGVTPLMLASGRGFVGIVEVLLAKGADVNAKSKYTTPLLSAVQAARLDVARMLLERGADPNLSIGGRHTLASAGSLPFVRLLVEKKVNPNLDGGARLRDAVKTGEEDVVRLLLEAGADPNPRDEKQEAAIYLAIALDVPNPIAELLLHRGADINRLSGNYSVVHALTMYPNRKPAELEWSLERGANPNLRTKTGWTPIELLELSKPDNAGQPVETSNRWAKLELLLKRGADVGVRFSDARFLAHHLAVWAPPQRLAVLKEAKADLNVRGDWNLTPLMVAAANGNESGVEWLLANGADLRAADQDGNTALHLAIVKGETRVVRQLLAAGADPIARTANGFDAAGLTLDQNRGRYRHTAGLNVPVLDKSMMPSPGGATPTLKQRELLEALKWEAPKSKEPATEKKAEAERVR